MGSGPLIASAHNKLRNKVGKVKQAFIHNDGATVQGEDRLYRTELS